MPFTAVFLVTIDGNFLPPQLVDVDKTPKSLPKVACPKDCDITFTVNHWCNDVDVTDNQYVNKIHLPYITHKRQ